MESVSTSIAFLNEIESREYALPIEMDAIAVILSPTIEVRLGVENARSPSAKVEISKALVVMLGRTNDPV